jgi:hypothetical protein
MDPALTPFLAPGGVALRREMLAAGLQPDEIGIHLRRGSLVRVRHGAYTDADSWLRSDAAARHLLRSRAVLASLKPLSVLSHTSAAIAWGLPVWGVDLEPVHVTRPGRPQSRRQAGVVHHHAALPDDQVVEVDGLLVTRPDRTVADMARLAGFEPGVVTADAALHRGLTAPEQLRVMVIAMQDWPGSRVCSRVVAFADGRSESVGESRTRVLFLRQKLPAPKLQVEIWSGPRLLGRVDFLLEESRTVVEFDGRLKYRLDDASSAEEAQKILWEEKRREDDIRGEGYGFSRVVWTDLDRQAATAARIRRAAQSNRSQGRRS